MPADRGTRRIFGDEKLVKAAGRKTCKFLRACAYAEKKFRHVFGFGQTATIEVITPAERDDTTLAGKTVEFKLFESKAPDMAEQNVFFLSAQEVPLIAEAWGESVLVFAE